MMVARSVARVLLPLLLLLAAANVNSNWCEPAAINISSCAIEKSYFTSVEVDQAKQNKSLTKLQSYMKVPCAPFVDLFICTVHMPMCINNVLVHPCKEFCLKVKGLCLQFVRSSGYSWPPILSCDRLQAAEDNALCMDPSNAFKKALDKLSTKRQRALQSLRQSQKSAQPPRHQPQPPATEPPDGRRSCSLAELRLGVGRTATCVRRCFADLLFNREDKDFANVWMQVWSVICLVSTALAVATFALDSDRFMFPERPMVWVSACYLLYACGYALRAGLGPEVACSRIQGPSAEPGLYRVSRHAGHWCAVVFLLLYFSSLAGCLWWVMMTVCWYLCAARKWAHEALLDKTMWLHVCAWGLPLLLSVVLLVLHRIEGDELTHLCVVDGSDRTNTLVFVIVPMSACLLVGLGFLISALCSTVSVRHSLKWRGNANFRRIEKLMTKISLFSFLFVLPSVCVLAANIYEYLERDKWTASLEKVLATPGCTNASGLLPAQRCRPEHLPSSAFFMLKIFMSLAVGLPSGLIVWFNCKSATAWHRCCSRVVLRRRPKAPQSAAAYSTVGSGVAFGKRQDQLLGSSHSKYPPVAGVGASDV